MRVQIFLFFSFFLWFPVNGQGEFMSKGFDPNLGIKDLTMDTWTNKNGLVSNNVISVFQAQDDYLWIASYNGLQKFDGNKFDIFDQTNVPFLSSNTIYEVTQDRDGVIWFCTSSSGIIGYHDGQFVQLTQHNSIPTSIVSILSDSKGHLWAGSKNNGLFKIDANGTTTKQSQIPNVTIHDIGEDDQQNIWVATDNRGVLKINGNEVRSFSKKNGLANDLVSTVYPKDNTLYVGTLNGVSMIKEDLVHNLDALTGEIINDLLVDDHQVLWIGSERGLIKYRLDIQTYELFTEKDGLPGKRVVDLFFDNEGSLWVCTYEGGLARFKTGIIDNLTIKDGLSSNQVHIIEKKDGRFYVGTQDGNVNIYDGQEVVQMDLQKEFRKDVIRDFLFDDQTLWIANYKGLVKIQNNQQTYFNQSSGLPDHNVRTIFKDTQQRLWLGTRTGGLIQFNPSGKHQVFDKNSGLLTNYVFCIEEDQFGNLLIGTNAGGLSMLSPDQKLSHYSIRQDNAGTLIFNIHVDDSNQVWLSTNLGLYRFLDGEMEKVNFYPDPKMEKFFDVVEDKAGNFWLSSPIGVLKIRRKDLDDFFERRIEFANYELFGEEDGMESQECTGATKSFFDVETGKLWVPTFEGAAIIDPSQKIINTKIPQVFITNVQIDNNSIFPIEDGVKIKPGTFRYLFDVTALSFLVPSKVQFKYRLEGIDEEWNGPSKSRRIEYTNLPYGDYTLQVKASNNDGVWNEEGAQLSFTVLPHFFEALWFRIGLVLFIVLLFWGFYTWRVYDIKKTNKVLRKMNSELDRFVYSASHDLRGPLTSTMGIVNLAQKETNPAQNKEYFNLIKQCTDKMNHFINELINYSKNKNDAIELKEIETRELVESVWAGLGERESSKKVVLEYETQGGSTFLGDETRLRVILRNLIHNAVIFSDPKKQDSWVKVLLKSMNGKVELIISDNGLGIPKHALERVFDMFYRANDQSIGSGLGLYVVKETAQKLNAKLEVESEEGQGSKFTISFNAN